MWWTRMRTRKPNELFFRDPEILSTPEFDACLPSAWSFLSTPAARVSSQGVADDAMVNGLDVQYQLDDAPTVRPLVVVPRNQLDKRVV